MIELIFKKQSWEYTIGMKSKYSDTSEISMTLDTGSPISIMCIGKLIEISQESYMTLINKIEDLINNNVYMEFGIYGSQEHNVSRKFIPYLLSNIEIGGQKLKLFLIWVDVTNYKDKEKLAITTTLFGFDYFKQGKKWFDNSDNLHMEINNGFTFDMLGVKGALTHCKKDIAYLRKLKELCNNQMSCTVEPDIINKIESDRKGNVPYLYAINIRGDKKAYSISANSPKEAIKELFQKLNRKVISIDETMNMDKANVFVALRGGKKKSQHYYRVKHY